MIIKVNDHCLYLPFEIYRNSIKFIFIIQHNIFNHVSFVFRVIKSNVYFLFSKDIFTSKIASLLNLERFDAIVICPFNYWLKNVDSTSLQPRITPVSEVKIFTHWFVTDVVISPLQAANEVRQCCVLPFIDLEVSVQARFKSLMSNHFIYLLQEWRAFAVWNSVKQWFCFICSGNYSTDWMSWRKLIGVYAPEFVL